MEEVRVKQPPKVGVRMSAALKKARKAEKAGLRMDARRVRLIKEQGLANRKAGKSRIKALNKEIRVAKAGARMNQRRARFHRDEKAAISKGARGQRRINKNMRAYAAFHIKSLRAQVAANKSAIKVANRQIHNAKWNIRQAKKANALKMKQANPRVRARVSRKERSLVAKSFNLLAAYRFAKKLFKKRKGMSDGRNHGATGVARGSRGRTGFAGRRSGR
jgi:hypothetical protein